ncbi:MAG: hypothetical protein H6745_04960 [Deltaproteobacteria bacterium]|nr:hypothetical protein [Deltaproteobacteria bacterium]
MSTTALLDELSTLCQRHLDAQRPRLTATPVTRGDRGADFIERVRGFDGPRITAWLAKAHELDPGFLQASAGGGPRYPGVVALVGFARDTYPAWLREHALPAAEEQLARAAHAVGRRAGAEAEEAAETCANLCRGVTAWSPRMAPEVEDLLGRAEALLAGLADGSAFAGAAEAELAEAVAGIEAAGARVRFTDGAGDVRDRFGAGDAIVARLALTEPLTETFPGPGEVQYYRLGWDVTAAGARAQARWQIRRRERFAAAYEGRVTLAVPVVVPDTFYDAIVDDYRGADGAFPDVAAEVRAWQHVGATFFPWQVAEALAGLPDGAHVVHLAFHAFAQTGGGGPKVEARGAFIADVDAAARASWGERATALRALGERLADQDDAVRRREENAAADAAFGARQAALAAMSPEERAREEEAALRRAWHERLMNHTRVRHWTDLHGRQLLDVVVRAQATRREGDVVMVSLERDGRVYASEEALRRPPEGETKRTWDITGWGSGSWTARFAHDGLVVSHTIPAHW